MDRRQFIHVVTSTFGALSAMQARVAYAQPGNPKVYLFGMFLIDNGSTPIKVQVPQLDAMDQHRAFVAASTAAIQALGGRAIPVNQQTGLHLIHADYTLARFPAAMPLQTAAAFSGGTGPTVVQQQLLDCLPSLSAVNSRAGGPQRSVVMPAGSFDITLSGGQLRLPRQRSRCPGADPAVAWQIEANGTAVGAPMQLTDMSVFESSEPTLMVTIGTNTVSLKSGEMIWVFNLPLLKAVDKTPREIEHVAEWTQLLNPPIAHGLVKATTTFPLVHANSGGPFNHPNLTLPGVRQSASAYFAKMHPTVTAAGIPPDSDLCMQFRS